MAGKQSKPVTGILTGSLISGDISGIFCTSPRIHCKPQSPKGLKTFDLGAVGLGIVAALEKNGEIPVFKAVINRSFSRSDPIPVNNSSINRGSLEEMETRSFEEYTIVTRHGPNESYTKVYGDCRKGDDRSLFRIRSRNTPSVFHISPVKITEFAAVPASDFLSSCNLCQKKLHDKDIYMYRGEKAFCSTECRYRQIVMDELTEKCSSEASIRPVEVAGSSYANRQILPTRILAI